MGSSDLIEQIFAGKRSAYAWGSGDIFEACRGLHGLPLRAVVHTSSSLIGTFIDGVPVISPESLRLLDPTLNVVIGYSLDYRSQIIDFVSGCPGLPLIFFDDPALLSTERISKLAGQLKLAIQTGVVKPTAIRAIRRALEVNSVSDASWGLERELERGYDFYTEHHRARYQALTSHSHFLHQENIPGDVVEFGTGYGTTAVFLAAAMADASLAAIAPWAASQIRQTRKLFLFDSFEGLPAITNKLDIEAGWKQGLFRDKSEQELRSMTEKYLTPERIIIQAGWFNKTLPSIPPNVKFSLIHIDCDIYESTIEVLEYLFAHRHVSNGCAIFFDDWNCGNGSPDLGERRAWREVVTRHQIAFSDCGGYGTYGNKFLIHLTENESIN